MFKCGQDITVALLNNEGRGNKMSRRNSGDEEARCSYGCRLLLANIMNEAARFTENYERK